MKLKGRQTIISRMLCNFVVMVSFVRPHVYFHINFYFLIIYYDSLSGVCTFQAHQIRPTSSKHWMMISFRWFIFSAVFSFSFFELGKKPQQSKYCCAKHMIQLMGKSWLSDDFFHSVFYWWRSHSTLIRSWSISLTVMTDKNKNKTKTAAQQTLCESCVLWFT